MPYIRVYLNDVLKEQIELDGRKITIGRSDQNDLVLKNAGVSATHAIIEPQGNQFLLSDNDSTNGVFINQEKISSQVLEYWDQIQIYNYVIKFMQRPALADEADPDLAVDSRSSQQHTMEISVSDVDELAKLRNQRKAAYLMLRESAGGNAPANGSYLLSKVNFFIGGGKGCDICTPGWFAPKFAAKIQRQHDGYYLLPMRRGKALVNGKKSSDSYKLNDKDKVSIRGVNMVFYHRLVEESTSQ